MNEGTKVKASDDKYINARGDIIYEINKQGGMSIGK